MRTLAHFRRNYENKPVSNNRSLIVGPSLSGKYYLILEKLKNNTGRDLCILFRSLEKYEDFDSTNVVSDIDE